MRTPRAADVFYHAECHRNHSNRYRLVCCSEIEKNIDHMTNLRKDKWSVEGKLRKYVFSVPTRIDWLLL